MKKVILFVAAALVLATGCDSYEQQNEFTEQALAETPSGYTPTNEDGAIVDSSEIDDGDWRTAPEYEIGVIVEPAFPNPAETGPIYLPITVTFPDLVQGQLVLCAFDANDNFFFIDNFRGAQGTYTFIMNLNQFGVDNRLVRVFVMEAPSASCRGAREVVSYGDILIR